MYRIPKPQNSRADFKGTVGSYRQCYIMRHADPFDARRVFVELSAEGLLMMERYWVKMWAIGAN